MIATFLLTGARSAEVLGLEVADISFDRQTVTIRPHEGRRLKTLTSARVVPLWDFGTPDWLSERGDLWHDWSHFKTPVGDLMLARIFGGTPVPPPGFGTLRGD